MRISREQMFMMMAHAAALRSTCTRLNVGAVVVFENNVLSIGYNGAPPGEPHCGSPCRHFNTERGKCEVVHAEDNALNRRHIPRGCSIYVTHSPCTYCAGLIVRVGIKEVFYGACYRDTAPLDVMARQGVSVTQVLPSGSMVVHP